MEKSLDGTKRIISKERLGQNAWAKQRVGGGHKAGETLERACFVSAELQEKHSEWARCGKVT